LPKRKIRRLHIDQVLPTQVRSKTKRTFYFFCGEAVSTSDATGLPILAENSGLELADSRATILPSRSVADPDDESLLVRLQAGNIEALGLLFHRHSRLLLGIARRVLQDNNEAEDLVQDVFLFLFYKGKTFDPAKGLARSWLMQVTYHRAYDRRRYLTTRSFYDRSTQANEALPPKSGDNPEEFLAWQSCLRPVFEELSEDQRRTLMLHFYEGYTIREISDRIGQPFGNVQHHLYRGIDRLRKHVFHRNGGGGK
jgi:RNA polymerase sigma-70 factor, ECF subfamily